MSSETSTVSYPGALSAASRASILRVWDIVNKHFESLLASSDRSATKTSAEINILSQVKELRDLMGSCSTRLKIIEAYISELHKQDTGDLTLNCPSRDTQSSELTGEWHFLYKEENSVFGYMKLVPGTVLITSVNGNGKESISVKRAEFTIPLGVLREANDVQEEDYTQLDRCCEYVLCPCCQISFKASGFWKHALFEIAERGNRVPAWQSLDRSETPRWIVDESSGWSEPIYRPRGLESTCEMGQSLADLNLKHYLSDTDFSRALDRTFECLASQLRI